MPEVRLHIVQALLEQYYTENIGRSIRDRAAWLKRDHKLKLPDAVIAATAMHLNAPLITRAKGFKKMERLLEVRFV